MREVVLLQDTDLRQILRETIRSELREVLPDLIRQNVSKEFLTIDETVELTGFSRRHLQFLRSEKRIPYHKHGRKILFNRSELLQFLEDNHIKPRGA
jgi:excisionase family DNA binding protein